MDKYGGFMDKVSWAQSMFSYGTCKEIFPDLTEHMWEKWISSGSNILWFWGRLDENNRSKLINWINSL